MPPWVGTFVSQENQDRKADDITMILAKHAIFQNSTVTNFDLDWRSGTATWTAGSSAEDPAFPVTRSFDGFNHLVTQPNTTGTTWTFLIDFGGTDVSFDSIFIGGHNFDQVNVSSLEVNIADDAGFTDRLECIAKISSPITSSKRLLFLDLGNMINTPPKRFTGVRYARLVVSMLSSGIPAFSELIFADRTQLASTPLLSYDPNAEESRVTDFESRSGVIRRFCFHKGRATRQVQLLTNTETDNQQILDWWRDTKEGTRPFVWIDCPTSAPQDAPLMLLDRPRFSFPFETNIVRRIQMNLAELPKFVSSEV